MKKNSFKLVFASAALLTLSHTLWAGNITQGKTKAAACAGCHGINGIGLSEEFPNLAGQKPAYIIKQLTAFKNGSRKDPTMNAMAATLSTEDMADLAAYFSSLKTSTTQASVTDKPKTDKASHQEFPENVYISMKKSATIETFPQQQSWTGGPNMLYTAITPNKKMLLSTSPSSNTVYVFNTQNGKQLAIIKTGKAPKGVKVSPDGKQAYISNQGSADITVINLRSLQVSNTIKVKKGPHNVRFTKDGKLAYVTLQGGDGLGIIDTQKQKLIRVIPVPGITGPHNLDLSADEKTAFVRDFVHHVAVVDLTTGKVNKIITVGNGHGGIDVFPNGQYAATAAIGDDYISIIDTRTLESRDIKIGTASHGIRVSKNSQWLYVTLPKENAIAVINTRTMAVEARIASGKFPFWIAVPGNP